ncbi:MAG: HlyC/CorC family transporter, partial [Acidimicrobiales bacterium]|nr:HlyC/CorC family transporter [Acidimicrobiales bacterium]
VAEALPKNLALASLDRTALRLAPLVRLLALIAPLRWVASGAVGIARRVAPERDEDEPDVSEEELLAFADEAVAAEAIDAEEQMFIRSVIEFGDTLVRTVMVPRPDIIAVPADGGVSDAIRVVLERGFSRLPVYGDGIDDIVGVVYAKDLLRHQADGGPDDALAALAREAHFVPETKRIAVLMREMQADSFHIALVVDEYGGTAGVVTLEDLIEELVGEIIDEFDVEEPMIEPLGRGRVRVNGRAPLDDVQELLGAELPQGEWSTVGGLIFNTLGHVPTIGESVEVGDNRFLVERVQGRRIARVQIVPVERERVEQT